MGQLKIGLCERGCATQVATRVQEGVSPIELYSSRQRRSTHADERRPKLRTFRSRAIESMSENVLPIETVRTEHLHHVRTISCQQAIIWLSVRIETEER